MGWSVVIPGVWRCEYTTGLGIESVSHAVSIGSGELLVVSPPSTTPDALFAETDALGKVTALVAPNSGHDMGQVAWQARYPDVVSYGPAVAIDAITRAKKLRPLKPLADLAARLPGNVKFHDVADTKSGMTLFTVDAGEAGRALFVDEILSNGPLSGPAPARAVFWLTGSGPGLARNKLWTWVFTKDKGSVARRVLAEIDAFRPTVLLPGHGQPIPPDRFDDARALLSAIA